MAESAKSENLTEEDSKMHSLKMVWITVLTFASTLEEAIKYDSIVTESIWVANYTKKTGQLVGEWITARKQIVCWNYNN